MSNAKGKGSEEKRNAYFTASFLLMTILIVIFGGCLNVFGDWFLVFPLGMGMQGAAIAAVCGTSSQPYFGESPVPGDYTNDLSLF